MRTSAGRSANLAREGAWVVVPSSPDTRNFGWPIRLSEQFATVPFVRSTDLREELAVQIAVVLYPGFTALDMVGPFEVLAFLPGAEAVLVAEHAGPVADETGQLVVNAAARLDEVLRPDVVLVPGGPGQTRQMTDGELHEWLRTVDQTSTWTTSVCTGSLILAAAGLLAGRRATTNWLAIDQLPALGVEAVDERVVVDGHYVTAAGVSAGIDMALTLAGRISGDHAAQMRQLSIQYAPQPPYDAGSPRTAPAAVVTNLLARSEQILGGASPSGA